mgnify:CR=1 FL=1
MRGALRDRALDDAVLVEEATLDVEAHTIGCRREQGPFDLRDDDRLPDSHDGEAGGAHEVQELPHPARAFVVAEQDVGQVPSHGVGRAVPDHEQGDDEAGAVGLLGGSNDGVHTIFALAPSPGPDRARGLQEQQDGRAFLDGGLDERLLIAAPA